MFAMLVGNSLAARGNHVVNPSMTWRVPAKSIHTTVSKTKSLRKFSTQDVDICAVDLRSDHNTVGLLMADHLLQVP